ncbi:alpha-(1 3)-fucosyltransferase C [Biomphalaria pfeifferi]|uniref:Fucosyltransferase n=1 Tax=Biomphalaria pfeifferi TaxID=112525 RepID=A0AAD8BNV1_BIOPF|nr:alpha-(1 3)-fucosyltransferase C [Biomphalaria pfeifferi]
MTYPPFVYQTNSTGETEFIPDPNIACTQTMFIKCGDTEELQPMKNETFNVGLLRRPSWMDDAGFFSFHKCPYSRCHFQDNKIDESTHLVILEIDGLKDNFKAIKRWPHQLYAAATWESRAFMLAQLLWDRNSFWNSQFNLTATYRTDADIFVPYGLIRFKPIPVEKRPNYYRIALQKTKWVAWIVSNCDTPSKRDIYIQQMQEIIDVDISGRCGEPCTDKSTCVENNLEKYRFYLSFENDFCQDYVTEKFFKMMYPTLHVIPVVRGDFDYKKYMPEMTYINTADFQNATELAMFLRSLSVDPLMYARYLERKSMYEYIDGSRLESLGCQVCKFLHTKKLEGRIDDMKKWIVDDKCHPPTDI